MFGYLFDNSIKMINWLLGHDLRELGKQNISNYLQSDWKISQERIQILDIYSLLYVPNAGGGGGGGGGGGWYSEFCLLQDYFWGFRILNFTIFGGLWKKWLFFGGYWQFAAIFRGSLLKMTIFFFLVVVCVCVCVCGGGGWSLSKFSVFFLFGGEGAGAGGGVIVRIGIRTFY